MNDLSAVLIRHKLDVGAFYRMAEAGIIGERDRIELIDGELIDMAPIGDDHYTMVNVLNEVLVVACLGRATVSVQNPLHIDGLNDLLPDFAIYRGGSASFTKRVAATSDNALLVVEVADCSLPYDRDVKLRLYAAASIPEYWIVDIPNRVLTVHRHPSADAYRDVVTISAGARLGLVADPQILIDVDRIFA